MKNFIVFVALFIAIIQYTATAQLQDSLYTDIEDGRLDRFQLIEAAFIISGTSASDSLLAAINWYNELLSDIQQKRFIDVFDKIGSAEKLFLYLHTTWLQTYNKKATTLLDIMQRKEFNCVSATILYNLTCDELGLNTMAFETLTHVYTIFTDFTQQVMVENTSPIGFNIVKNLQRYSQHMSQYYPENEIYKIGLHRLYAYENSRGRQISNSELLGLICYNQALFTFEQGNYKQAYDYVLLAQSFNQDSRSNQKFEIGLYYKWGKTLFDKQEFYQAFEVFADAYYRYSQNDDFRNNCIVSFINTQDVNWLTRDWQNTVKIFYEIEELDILNEKEYSQFENLLTQWGYFFYHSKQKDDGKTMVRLLKEVSSDKELIDNFERLINSLP